MYVTWFLRVLVRTQRKSTGPQARGLNPNVHELAQRREHTPHIARRPSGTPVSAVAPEEGGMSMEVVEVVQEVTHAHCLPA